MSFQKNLPWYKSRVIIGAAISILAKLLFMAGYVSELGTENLAELTDLALLLVGSIGDYVVIRARVVQDTAPKITLTKRG